MKNKSYNKYCKKCSSKEVIKFGIKRGKQRYKYKSCNHIFCNSSRIKNVNKNLYKDFSKGKKTYKKT